MALPKANRIVKQSEFDQVFKEGRGGVFNYLRIKSVVNTLNINRVAVVVPKKIAKSAVDRNRLRRVATEIFAEIFKNWQYPFTLDIVVLVSKFPQKDREDFELDINQWLKKLLSK